MHHLVSSSKLCTYPLIFAVRDLPAVPAYFHICLSLICLNSIYCFLPPHPFDVCLHMSVPVPGMLFHASIAASDSHLLHDPAHTSLSQGRFLWPPSLCPYCIAFLPSLALVKIAIFISFSYYLISSDVLNNSVPQIPKAV